MVIMSNKTDYNARNIASVKERHSIIINLIHQEDITIINEHTTNNRTPKLRKHNLTVVREKTGNSTTTGDFKTHHR